jgi:hypothetical protein
MPRIKRQGQRVGGYQLYRETDLVSWIGPVLYRAESRGPLVVAENKVIAGEARLIGPVEVWTPRVAVRFAVECAERVIKYFEAACPDDGRPRQALRAAGQGAVGQEMDATAELNGAKAAAAAVCLYAGSEAGIEAEAEGRDGVAARSSAGADSDAVHAESCDECAAVLAALTAAQARRAAWAVKARRAARTAAVEAARAAVAAAEAAWALAQAGQAEPTDLVTEAVRAAARAVANAAEAASAAKAATCADAWESWAAGERPGNAERQWQTRRLLELIGASPKSDTDSATEGCRRGLPGLAETAV